MCSSGCVCIYPSISVSSDLYTRMYPSDLVFGNLSKYVCHYVRVLYLSLPVSVRLSMSIHLHTNIHMYPPISVCPSARVCVHR